MRCSGFEIRKVSTYKNSLNSVMTKECKVPVFLNSRMRLQAIEDAIVSFRIKNYNELSDNKQFCVIPNPKSVSVLLNILDIPITLQRGGITRIHLAGEN